MTFRVGQKVVCIGHVIPDPSCTFPVFQKGTVYTVSLIEEFEGLTFLTVEELHPSVTGDSRGFRPIVERKTDISIFTKMLTPEGVDA